MTIPLIRSNQIRVLFVATFCLMAAAGSAPAQTQTNADGEITVDIKIKREKQAVSNLETKVEVLHQNTQAAAQRLATADADSRPRLDETFKAAQAQEEQLRTAVKEINEKLKQAQLPKNRAQSEQFLDEASVLIGVTYLHLGAVQLHTDFVKDLAERAAASEGVTRDANEFSARGGAAHVFSEDERGGGVFLDQPAIMPIAAATVTRAEYDLGLRRFVLHQGANRVLLLPMDPDLTATVINCLYSPPPRNQIVESFNLDPVSMLRTESETAGTVDVLFGCERMWNTEVGRILIDADDLLQGIFSGRNRRGDDLTREYQHASLGQTILDHPVFTQIRDLPVLKREIDMRYWISPERISTRLAGGEIVFGEVSFHLFTQTVKLSSPKVFDGKDFPNPGADVFAAYFNQHFGNFAHLVLRDDETTSRSIRPFEELRELAKIAGTVIWIRDAHIAMDRSWAAAYSNRRAFTDTILEDVCLDHIEKDLRAPAVIFNQYGPSRVLDEQGRMFQYKYDDAGRFVKIVRVEKDSAGRIREVSGALVSGSPY